MLRIAFRNIFRQKRRTILTMLTMFGGFVLASISISWSDGTYSYVIDMFTRNQLGHIQIHKGDYLDRPTLYKTIDDFTAVGDSIQHTPGVVTWTPRLFSAGLASVGEKSSAVRVIGVDPQRESAATNFDRKVTEGSVFSDDAANQVILGSGLALRLQANVGDELVIVSQAADGSIANDLYIISGLMSSGDDLSDQTSLYLHLDDAQELFALYDRVHEIAVIVEDLDHVEESGVLIAEQLNDTELSVATWHEFARSFYVAMKTDQEGSWIMLFIIVLVVAVGVLNTVLMTVLERRREYGVLKAVGTAPGQIFRLVVAEVIIMAFMALTIGFAVSYGANYWLSFEGVPIPEPITYGGIVFDAMYSEINLRCFLIPAIAVLTTGVIVSFFPALRAARVAPARAMRTH